MVGHPPESHFPHSLRRAPCYNQCCQCCYQQLMLESSLYNRPLEMWYRLCLSLLLLRRNVSPRVSTSKKFRLLCLVVPSSFCRLASRRALGHCCERASRCCCCFKHPSGGSGSPFPLFTIISFPCFRLALEILSSHSRYLSLLLSPPLRPSLSSTSHNRSGSIAILLKYPRLFSALQKYRQRFIS